MILRLFRQNKCVGLYCFLFFLAIIGCKENKKHNTSNPELYKEYIVAYPESKISRSQYLKIVFKEHLAEKIEDMPSLKSDILGCYPAVKFDLSWESTNTLAFKSKSPLNWNEVYYFSLNLKRLFPGISNTLEYFTFSGRTENFNLSIIVPNIPIVEANSPSNLFDLKGTIVYPKANTVSLEELTNAISVQQNGKKLDIQIVDFDNTSAKQSFIIKGVERLEEKSKVKITCDHTIFDSKGETNYELPVAADGEFTLVEVNFNSESANTVNLYFSEELTENQDLTGLVYIKGYKEEISYLKKGNQLILYLAKKLQGSKKVVVSPTVRSKYGNTIGEEIFYELNLQDLKPEIQMLSVGNIIPPTDGKVLLPIKTMNLNKVLLEIFKIYPNNTFQFLQKSSIRNTDAYELQYVGEVVKQERINLNSPENKATPNVWNFHSIDINKYVDVEPGAVYQVRLAYEPSDVLSYCQKSFKEIPIPRQNNNKDLSLMDYLFYDYEYHKLSAEETPSCGKISFGPYSIVKSVNVLSSNLGVIVKKNENDFVSGAITRISDAEPLDGATITFYDHIHQPIQTFTTEGGGLYEGKLNKTPFIAIAKFGDDIEYIKLKDGLSLALGSFDVKGQRTPKGLKGYIYGDRGVWRPGDSVYTHFVLQDKTLKIPTSHPIIFEVFTPSGKSYYKKVKSNHQKHLYSFPFKTNASDPTGAWMAKVKIGKATFSKVLKVETIKPNRMVALIEDEKRLIYSNQFDNPLPMNVKWLQGTPAQNTKVTIDHTLRKIKPNNQFFNDFIFHNPIELKVNNRIDTWTGNTNESGELEYSLPSNENFESYTRSIAEIRSYETGGNFSTQYLDFTFSPYKNYVGVKIPEGRYGGKYLYPNDKEEIEVALVTEKGAPVTKANISYTIYKLKYNWWYQRQNSGLHGLADDIYQNKVKEGKVTTSSKGSTSISTNHLERGPYLIVACDGDNHCSGDKFYVGSGWDYWDSGNDGMTLNKRKSASRTLIKTNQKKYKVGEQIEFSMPTNSSGNLLVSIENGNKVIKKFWQQPQENQTTVSFEATEEMSPNIYIHVSYLQAHNQVENDLPIRLYGIASVLVENENTILNPVIESVNKTEPERKLAIKVSEKNGKEMAYTLSVVDEGLLSLTNFKTPNPHHSFYSKEALGVKTWDMYDNVIGGFAGQMEKISSIGGDELSNNAEKNKQANRFKSIAKTIGTFTLQPGASKNHQVDIPLYLGAVRLMVTAVSNEAYGSAEKQVEVSKPVMGLTTMPRVLNVNSELKIPVTVFVNEDNYKSVTVAIKSKNGFLKIEDAEKNISFKSRGEKTVYFDAKILNKEGIENIEIATKSKNSLSKEKIEIKVYNPNPFVYQNNFEKVPAGQSLDKALTAIGLEGTNTINVEWSSIPPLNLEYRLRSLIRYPHGCIEQTTSKAFPQLLVNQIIDIDSKKTKLMESNVKAAIDKLSRFQMSNGSFSYWQGGQYSDWGTSYAGHFLLEAQKLGYFVPKSMIENWKLFQFNESNSFDKNKNIVLHAYRLFTLALCGESNLGALNRFREYEKKSGLASLLLAASYQLVGKEKIAKEITNNINFESKNYRELSYSYGSTLRDNSFALLLSSILKDDKLKNTLIPKVSDGLNYKNWLSTQETAFALIGMSSVINSQNTSLDNVAISINKESISNTINTSKALRSYTSNMDEQCNLSAKNNTQQPVYVSWTIGGKPSSKPVLKSTNQDLGLTVNYYDKEGESIQLNEIEQGMDITVQATIKSNTSRYRRLDEMALEMVFPPGWEIRNSRIGGDGNASQNFEYQDIRDDKIYTYFDMGSKSTKTFTFNVNAAYEGVYQMPVQRVYAMYDETLMANTANKSIKILKN